MIKHYRPYTKSRRSMSVVDYSQLSDVKPMKRSRYRIPSPAGRNNRGRITVRHQGGGVKRLYREIDFRQFKINVPGKVEALEYDPYRSAFIMRVLYKDGDRRYHLAPEGIKVGDAVLISENAELKVGNRLPLKNIPVGYNVHNIELNPGRGGQIVRSAGSQAQVMAQGSGYTDLKIPSGEVRRVLWANFASIGQVSNPDHILVSMGKAGRSRMKGIRPTVRGSVMNPVDHPYGGGEGKQPRGTKRPKTKWGKVTGGHKTRKRKKYSARLIVSRRVKKIRKK
ncbi:MAG: 50S ribosomal protein L2 [Patescibacteria group bacterium]|nr:50S ribosomal protein L2 [Patescibacteria group bacterium]MCL5224297.1 50S ribosomal protein L2 [Patescibacteria group bacterium]